MTIQVGLSNYIILNLIIYALTIIENIDLHLI